MVDILNMIPAVVRILAVFALILFIIKAKWSLGNAFLAGAAGLGGIFGMGPAAIGKASLSALLDPKTLSLSVVVSLILILSHCLEKTGQMERILLRFKGLLPWARVNLVIFPALIGLLPMPGGAIFSAPMVKAIGTSQGLVPLTVKLCQLLVSAYLGVLVAPLSRYSSNHDIGRGGPLGAGLSDNTIDFRCGFSRLLAPAWIYY